LCDAARQVVNVEHLAVVLGNDTVVTIRTRHLLQWQSTPTSHIHYCSKTWGAHFRVAFYCPQNKVDLCNDHAV
jgi:hypothetical protein